SILYNSRSTLGGLVSRLNYATKPRKSSITATYILYNLKFGKLYEEGNIKTYENSIIIRTND
ncbi:hypothetical protein, partial [Vibrio parahaemolyticus]|uniref:hypothetical protein n=1 Tax=Vibrio parahaemolyticus TaxID=670 RepID=UPI002554C8FB